MAQTDIQTVGTDARPDERTIQKVARGEIGPPPRERRRVRVGLYPRPEDRSGPVVSQQLDEGIALAIVDILHEAEGVRGDWKRVQRFGTEHVIVWNTADARRRLGPAAAERVKSGGG